MHRAQCVAIVGCTTSDDNFPFMLMVRFAGMLQPTWKASLSSLALSMMDSSCLWFGDLAAGAAAEAGARAPPSLASLLSAIQRIAAMSFSVNILSDLSGCLHALSFADAEKGRVGIQQNSCISSDTLYSLFHLVPGKVLLALSKLLGASRSKRNLHCLDLDSLLVSLQSM